MKRKEEKNVNDIIGGKKLPIKISTTNAEPDRFGKDAELCIDTYGIEGVFLDIELNNVPHSSLFVKTEVAEQLVDLLARAVEHQKSRVASKANNGD